MSVQVSVIVPTYKRPELLRRCLKALLMQEFDPAAYEIIVVDDGPSEATRRVVEGQNDRGTHVRYVPMKEGQHGPAAARNCGWQTAAGEIIAFTDDDCLPDRGWLRAGVAAFTPDTLGVWGRIEVPLPADPTDHERNTRNMEHGRFLTANCFYRRCALAAVGGFDEAYTIAWREDTDLYITLLKHFGDEERFAHAPEALVVHPTRPAPWGISIREQSKSMFNALLYKKDPDLYRAHCQPGPPWRYYRIVAVLLSGLLGLVTGRRWLSLPAFVTWVALTGRFCRRRLEGTSRAPAHVLEMIVTSVLIPPLSVFWRLRGAVRYRALFV